jgi:hypothetical protein
MMLRILNMSEYSSYYENNLAGLVHSPFLIPGWTSFQEHYFNDRFHFLALEEKGVFKAGAGVFSMQTDVGRLYYSFGRYGVNGLCWGRYCQSINHAKIAQLVRLLLDAITEELDPGAISVCLGSLTIARDEKAEVEAFKQLCTTNQWKYFSRINHVADLSLLVDDHHELNLRNFNRNIRRNLSKAQSAGLKARHILSSEALIAWHDIHKERVSELEGKTWELDLFLKSLEEQDTQNYFTFFGVYHNENLVGGASCFFNSNLMDVFMMSTKRRYQQLGANHLLTEKIYRWCIKKDIKYINWQGSNPPKGGVAEFKRQWMGREKTMHAISRIFNDEALNALDFSDLVSEKKDRFFYPLG